MSEHNIKGLFFHIIGTQKCSPTVFIIIFFLSLISYFLLWPIVMYDTDLWYHLSGGKYFWNNGAIARDAYISFITPQKTWYNYYWLFQAIVYTVFQWAGYYGLIILRCLIYSLTCLFICFCFVRRHKNRTGKLLGLFLFITCTFLILHRELLVRPHLFSYLFIVVFLYILEFRRDRIWILPILGILWSNVHGIEYPVMFLIVFAYLAEIYWWQIRKNPPVEGAEEKTKWLMISVFYTVFLTPGVIELVQTPFDVSFQNAAYQHLYVAELMPIPFNELFIFKFSSVKGLIFSFRNVIVSLAMISFLIGLWRRDIRISHAILFLGALVLLAKHNRFTYEFALLSIPILRSFIGVIAKKDRISKTAFAIALPVVVLIVPLVVFHGEFANRPAYPFSQSNLPTGVVRFLNQNAPGGKILNEPNTGGYLPWALSPRFKIFMDMQMSIFSDTDFATVQNAFSNINAFKKFIQKYDPSFISVSLNRIDFKKIVEAEPRFVPVFFDHAELLYVNKDKCAELAGKYQLKVIDPFRYREMPYEEMSEDALNTIFLEAIRIYHEDPENYSINHILASIMIVRKQYNQAISHAEIIIRQYPEQSHGYALKGDGFFGMERYAEAASLYEKAMNMGQASKLEKVYWNLHVAYVKLKKYKKAYRLLSKYVNPFSPNADYREIYQLGMSAASVGKEREAVKFLEIARMKVPPSDEEYVQKIEKNLSLFGYNVK